MRTVETESQTEHIEKIESGIRKECNRCFGKGKFIFPHVWWSDRVEICGHCEGKGWLELQSLWI